ncbi:MAG: FliM/FliN family flagellar motor switch protein [Pseudomonadota bacterium]
MNLAQTFAPARALAQHCPELTERGPRPEERAEQLAAWRRDVAREVALDVAQLLSGTKLDAQLGEPQAMRGDAMFDRIGAVAANCLLRCGLEGQTVLLSFSVETAIALTDRSFGGTGEPIAEPAQGLPRSAGLLMEQAGRMIAQAIARVSTAGGAADEVQGDVIIRSESASRLKPFSPLAECMVIELTLRASDGIRWTGMIAMSAECLGSLLPGVGSGAHGKDRADAKTDPQETALIAIPLSLQAVLAEFDLSLSQLDRLAPGDRIPLAIARDIPLRAGQQLVASGSLGTTEDRMALRLTRIAGGAAFAVATEPAAIQAAATEPAEVEPGTTPPSTGSLI